MTETDTRNLGLSAVVAFFRSARDSNPRMISEDVQKILDCVDRRDYTFFNKKTGSRCMVRAVLYGSLDRPEEQEEIDIEEYFRRGMPKTVEAGKR